MVNENLTKFGLGVVKTNAQKMYLKAWAGSFTKGSSTTNMDLDSVAGIDMYTDPRVLPITTGTNPLTLVNNYFYGGVGQLGQPGVGTYGIYDPTDFTELQKAQCNHNSEASAETGHLPIANVQQWSTTNPHGLVVYDDFMYLQANDCNPNTGKCGIYRYSMINNSFVELGSVYTFDPRASSVTPWKGAGAGLDLFFDERGEAYLIAVFYRYTNQGISYTYGPSTVVKYKISDGFISTHVASPNVSGVVVEGENVYVTSFGGPQVAMGNVESKLEIFQHFAEDIDFEWQFTVNDFNRVKFKNNEGNDEDINFGGDIVDIAFKAGKAYIYLAHYDSGYDHYMYRIVCVSKASLLAKNLDGARATKEYKTTHASPCLGFLPGEGDKLYLADGVDIKEIDTSIAPGQFTENAISIEPLKSASDFENGLDIATIINTAAIVIDRSVARTAGNGVRASVTKMAKRLARPDELERRE